MLEHRGDGRSACSQPPRRSAADRTCGGDCSRSARCTIGPVDERLIALAQLTESIDGTPIDGAWILLSGGLGTIDLFLDPDEVAAAVAALRVFRGYSGWGSGQLDDELAAGAWMVLPAESSDVFGPNPKDLWRDVLRRQGGRIAWLANAPDDLSAN